MTEIDFKTGDWHDVLCHHRRIMQEEIETFDRSSIDFPDGFKSAYRVGLPPKDFPDGSKSAYRVGLSLFIKYADALIAGIDDSDTEKKMIYVLGQLNVSAAICSVTPFASTKMIRNSSDIVTFVSALNESWLKDTSRKILAKRARRKQASETHAARNKELEEIAVELRAKGVTNAALSRRTLEEADFRDIWSKHRYESVDVAQIREILRAAKIIPPKKKRSIR